jgi:hypothetical protein
MSATETPRVDALVPIHSVWNCRLRHSGSGRIAGPSLGGFAPAVVFALLHVRQLEAAGLIKVASTRMVSGILEQRYQACQQDLMFGVGFIAEHADESEAALQAALDRYRTGLFAALRAGRLAEGDVPAEESYRKPVLFLSDLKVSRAKAAELKSKLEEIMDSLKDETGDDPDGVPVNLLIGCYVPADPQPPA